MSASFIWLRLARDTSPKTVRSFMANIHQLKWRELLFQLQQIQASVLRILLCKMSYP